MISTLICGIHHPTSRGSESNYVCQSQGPYKSGYNCSKGGSPRVPPISSWTLSRARYHTHHWWEERPLGEFIAGNRQYVPHQTTRLIGSQEGPPAESRLVVDPVHFPLNNNKKWLTKTPPRVRYEAAKGYSSRPRMPKLHNMLSRQNFHQRLPSNLEQYPRHFGPANSEETTYHSSTSNCKLYNLQTTKPRLCCVSSLGVRP